MTERPQVEKCLAVGRCMAHPASYKDAAKPSYSYTEPTMKRIATVAMEKLEAARKADVETHERNLPVLEANRQDRARIEALMVEIGIPKTWRERDMKSRARYPKHVTHDAGYLGDMQRNLPITDGFEASSASYESLKAKYAAYALEAEGEDERRKAAADEADKRRREERLANVELAEIILRYGLDREAEWSDVLEALRKKDQRLDLAVAMTQTRGNWSEGPYRVSSALDRFRIETDEDKEIATDIVGCMHEFEDGRVFRDTTWNYGRLFASVADQQLSQDVQTAMNHGTEY